MVRQGFAKPSYAGSNPVLTSVTEQPLSERASATTLDALLGGRVRYTQPSRGYRVALEAPLLARFAIEGRSKPFRRVVDLGAGPGAIALCLLVTGWARGACAIERDADHAALAVRNAIDNGVGERLEVVASAVDRLDARALSEIGGADLVISNPPYFDVDAGAKAPDERRAASRALVDTSLASFVRAARKLLGRDGRCVIAFPASRLGELLDALGAARLSPKRMRFVHARASSEAQVVFVEAKPARPGGLVVEPCCAVRGEGEAYTRQTEDALWGRWPSPDQA